MKKVWNHWNGVRVYCRRVVRSAGRYASCSSWRGRTTVCLTTVRRCSRSYDDSAQCNRQTPDQSSYTAGTLNKLLSSEILKICTIPTLHNSCTKGAVIERDIQDSYCKILSTNNGCLHVTKGNDLILPTFRLEYDPRSLIFPVVNMEQFAQGMGIGRL